jgi:predicted O-methyltransferase YrrM
MFLLFPCIADRALEFYNNQNENLKKNIIAASSIEREGLKDIFVNYISLDDIHAKDFRKKLDDVVKNNNITAIICASDIVAARFNELNYPLPIINISTDVFSAIKNYDQLSDLTSEAYNNLISSLGYSPKITEKQILELLHICSRIPGQTSLKKIIELIRIFEFLPIGNIVEIGVLFGKSATALGYLNNIYNNGQIYLVDTWKAETARQNDSPEFIKNIVNRINWNSIYERAKLEISSAGIKNYHVIKGTVKDLEIYLEVKNKTKEKVISLAHIDGNHDYDAVKKDIESIFNWMKPGGIVICDDYEWVHGKGVKEAVEEIAEIYAANIKSIEVILNSAIIYLM